MDGRYVGRGVTRPPDIFDGRRFKLRKFIPLSNNRSNNRRRGRGNNRSQGGNQLNRIDSRARGNAPQLLEKYRKLAQDSALNGDRVQAEYYLQFADHYFRVIADSKAQKDEMRPRRDADRDQSEDFDDDGDESERNRYRGRGQGEDAPESEESEQVSGDEDSVAPEPVDNPFTRGNRGKPRKARRDRKPEVEAADGEGEASLDPATLPPAIAREEDDGQEEAPRRQRRPRTRRNDDDETLQAVS